MTTVYCLSCDGKIEVSSKARVGQFVFCEVCGTDFEIIQMNPLELDYAYDGDDYDDDDDDEYEEYESDRNSGGW